MRTKIFLSCVLACALITGTSFASLSDAAAEKAVETVKEKAVETVKKKAAEAITEKAEESAKNSLTNPLTGK